MHAFKNKLDCQGHVFVSKHIFPYSINLKSSTACLHALECSTLRQINEPNALSVGYIINSKRSISVMLTIRVMAYLNNNYKSCYSCNALQPHQYLSRPPRSLEPPSSCFHTVCLDASMDVLHAACINVAVRFWVRENWRHLLCKSINTILALIKYVFDFEEHFQLLAQQEKKKKSLSDPNLTGSASEFFVFV